MIGSGSWCWRARSAPSLTWAMITSVLIAGHQRLVPVVALPLVLDEVARLEHLADVVEVGPDANQQPPGADRFGGGFGDRADGDRMVVRARVPGGPVPAAAGWAGSPSSSRLMSVSTPNKRSTNGSRPVIRDPAIKHHSASTAPRITSGAKGVAWSVPTPIAVKNTTIAATSPTLRSLLRLRTWPRTSTAPAARSS